MKRVRILQKVLTAYFVAISGVASTVYLADRFGLWGLFNVNIDSAQQIGLTLFFLAMFYWEARSPPQGGL